MAARKSRTNKTRKVGNRASRRRPGRTDKSPAGEPRAPAGAGLMDPGPGNGAAGLPVVGMGASAGGLDAFKRFFKAMPPDSGLAFILVPHLDPKHESLMAHILANHTAMPVCEAEEGMTVEANRVYIIPPNKYLALMGGKLRLSSPEPRGLQTAIDFFLRSLAEDKQEWAIGIVLSGTGSHGTLGLQTIKTLGGLTIVQDPATAEYDQMPSSAIATGVVDSTLAVEEMPAALIKYVKHSYVNGTWMPPPADEKAPDDLGGILALLRARTRYDFHSYRKKMVLRRIWRRMSLRHLDQLGDYLGCLREDPNEVKHLFRDLLIGVTGFFREPEAFRVLEKRVIPQLIGSKGPDRTVRVWVAGCATGEEAYSIAMLLVEQTLATKSNCQVQIFATDINEHALELARQGVYPASVVACLAAKRLKRFFTGTEKSHYQIKKNIRELITFAPQNLIADAPFSKLDLISCRNLLIYLEPDIQRKLIALFHFALNDGGYLLLGSSETVGRQTELFGTVSKKCRVFQRRGPTRRDLLDFPIAVGVKRAGRILDPLPLPAARKVNFAELTQRALLQDYSPAAVLIDREQAILYVHGSTTRYLELPTGAPTSDLLSMARQGLRTKLRTAIHKAISAKERVKITGLCSRPGEAYGPVEITVQPIREPPATGGLLLVTFREPAGAVAGSVAAHAPGAAEDSSLVRQLEHELQASRLDLQSTIEEMESSNEEFKVSNEEVMSMNEELQSANEELETSKEELQSLNEELSTVNIQLQEKLEELEAANNDITNLLTSTDIATVFLDTRFCIKRFTPATSKLLNLVATDVGRPISDFSRKFTDESLVQDAQRVLDKPIPLEKEVSAEDGRWYLRRILPYRTSDKRIEGVIITLVDITQRKRMYDELEERVKERTQEISKANERLQRSEHEFHTLADNVPALFSYVDAGRFCRYVNRRYEEYLGRPRAEILGKPIRETAGRELYEQLGEQMDGALSGKEAHFEAAMPTPRLGVRRLAVTFVPDRDREGHVGGVFALMHDVTELKQAEEAAREGEERLRAILNTAAEGIITMDEHGVIEDFNPAAERMFAYSAGEAIGENVRTLLASPFREEQPNALLRRFETTQKGLIGRVRTIVGRRKDGSTFPMELNVSELSDPKPLFIGVARDETERMRTQERLLQSERLAAIGEAMAGLAHESRNALQRSQGGLERLRLRFKEQPGAQEIIAQIQKAQDDLHRLYENVREYSQPIRISPEPCPLDRIIEETWDDLALSRQGREARLRQERGGVDVTCRVDSRIFQQVFRNILENSLAAKDGGLEVRVEYSEAELDGEPALRISVLDDGPGLGDEARERIFDTFFSAKIHGMGLGMAIARRMIEAHGGRIAVGSPPKGTEIIITMPREGKE